MAIETKFFKVGTDKIFNVGSSIAGINPYAQGELFIQVANITNPTQQEAIRYLVRQLVDNELINKFNFIYPFIGGDATRHSYNLINPNLYQLTFFGGWTHSTNGATPNDINTYADTGFNPVTAGLAYNNNHLSYYSRTSTASVNSNNYDMGSGNAALGGTTLFVRRPSNLSGYTTGTFAANGITYTNTDGQGFYIGSSIPNTGYYYKNGAQVAIKVTLTNVALLSFNYYVGGSNVSGTSAFYTNKECAFASAGQGLTPSEMVTFNTIVQQYQTILGRNV